MSLGADYKLSFAQGHVSHERAQTRLIVRDEAVRLILTHAAH